MVDSNLLTKRGFDGPMLKLLDSLKDENDYWQSVYAFIHNTVAKELILTPRQQSWLNKILDDLDSGEDYGDMVSYAKEDDS